MSILSFEIGFVSQASHDFNRPHAGHGGPYRCGPKKPRDILGVPLTVMASRASLPKVCIALGFPDATKLLQHARREVQEGERFLEFRLDYLADVQSGIEAIRTLRSEYPDVTLIATCRRHQNHGHFNGSIEQQVSTLEAAIDAGAHAVDLEIESAEIINPQIGRLRSRSFLIVSYHNFETTPLIDAVVKRLMRVDADAFKLVTTARKPTDVHKVLSVAKTLPKTKMILLAMGEVGFPTRILSPAFGSLYTYAAPLSAEGTASGQVCAKVLRGLYRVEKFSRLAKIYGVIADPVRHSISPAVHNRAFQAKRMDAVYVPFLVQPAHLKDFMQLAEKLPVCGFSVTIPHKQKILRYIDIIDPLARRIGAVNTVWKKAGKWRGINTDVHGVIRPLSKRLKLAKSSVLLVGNGGAARGAAFALLDAGAKLSITGRNPDRIRALAKLTGAEPVAAEQAAAQHYDALVHATPLGMHPHVNECFFDGDIPADVVFDMVYNPMETLLIRKAKDCGREIVPGIDMFIEQAVQQFEAWTNDTAPRSVMLKAALEALRQAIPLST
jgi:3-dehydroquinate dehydratase/shikimate dehydrogenase